MKVAVVGYGRMGREVESVLQERGHEPLVVKHGSQYPSGCAVGIDFTRAGEVAGNVAAALRAESRYVVGTTGWDNRAAEVRDLVQAHHGGFVHAANFAIGVNLFYRIAREAADLLSRFPAYDPYVLERHHRLKKDAPSGTAKVLGEILEAAKGPRLRAVTSFAGSIPEDAFHVASVRAGGVIGEHTVGFDSGSEEILLEHRARSRRTFAEGAVLAAEWIATRTGFYRFDEVLDDLLPPS